MLKKKKNNKKKKKKKKKESVFFFFFFFWANVQVLNGRLKHSYTFKVIFTVEGKLSIC